MKHYNKNIFLLFVYVLLISPIHAQNQKANSDFIVAKDVVQSVRAKFKTFQTYEAAFSIILIEGKSKKYRKGNLFFQKPDKVRMAFDQPYSQIVVSDGKTAWIYLPSHKLLGEQNLQKNGDESFFAKTTPAGLDRLFSLYHYSFDEGKQPREEKIFTDSQPYYVLNLRQKVMTSGFRTIKLWVDKDHFIRKMDAENALGKQVIITFDAIKTGHELSDQLFVFDTDKYRIKSTIKDPLVQP